MAQTVSSTWNNINEYLDHDTRWKVVIGNDTYYDPNISFINITKPLFDTFGIGGVCASKLELTIDPNSLNPVGTIPTMATINVFSQISYGDPNDVDYLESEWIPKGTYWIDTRQTLLNGLVELTCYDAMLKAEQFWYNGTDWTKPAETKAALTDICTRIGVPLDSRNGINTFTSYSIDWTDLTMYDLTMRDVLSYIAIGMGGNWFITDDNKLRLVTLSDIPPETNLLATDAGSPILFGDVRIIL